MIKIQFFVRFKILFYCLLELFALLLHVEKNIIVFLEVCDRVNSVLNSEEDLHKKSSRCVR